MCSNEVFWNGLAGTRNMFLGFHYQKTSISSVELVHKSYELRHPFHQIYATYLYDLLIIIYCSMKALQVS